MELNKVVSEKLNFYLGKSGWSTYKLSRKTGLTSNTIQCILSCKYQDVKLSTIIVIANAFGMTASEFLDDDKFKYENLKFKKF